MSPERTYFKRVHIILYQEKTSELCRQIVDVGGDLLCSILNNIRTKLDVQGKQIPDNNKVELW